MALKVVYFKVKFFISFVQFMILEGIDFRNQMVVNIIDWCTF